MNNSITLNHFKKNYEQILKKSLNILRNVGKNPSKCDKWNIQILKQTINKFGNSYPRTNRSTWLAFINQLVHDDNKLEGLNITERKVSQIVTDLRLKGNKSKYCSSKYHLQRELIEVAGHATMYDYILTTNDKISIYSIKKLHKLLFQFTPHSEYAGVFRQCNNRIQGSKVETVDYTKIHESLFFINQEVMDLIEKKDKLSFCDYIDRCVRIHHEIVIVHPFSDGNGRVSRAFLNWLFKLKDLPPVFIKPRYKQKYFDAMEKAYIEGDFTDLQILFYKRILSSLIELNEIEKRGKEL